MLKYRLIVWCNCIGALLFIACSLIIDLKQVWQVIVSWLMGAACITVAVYYTDKMNKDS
ncbi:hypothetical protein MH117_13545 [Paenibacillus sp. ACRRX]|uniref:hypothetical protein n=1 Tax=unclassified Paenibacillus TaxID=185978 RepID=UPI001EF5F168|nr:MULTISPECIES: hypothetical protein [unclassified Paenibacillus]MCG7408449.1 hypothetical protein [Paenibacillus sp. ACRRX]MDK8182687.1 hypothetical protein [Paenibacillus sp. UMB4589-SE434]